MVVGGGFELSKGVSHLRSNCVLTMGEKERERETVRYVLPQPHGGRQMYLAKSGVGTRQGRHG